MDDSIQKKYSKCKFKVKKWEGEFKKTHGTNPSKVDIKNAPGPIREAYKTYWTLKTQSLETSLVDVSFDDEVAMDGFPSPSPDNFGTMISLHEPSEESNQVIEMQQDARVEATLTKQEKSNLPNELSNANAAEDKSKSLVGNSEESKIPSSVWGPHLSNANKKPDQSPKINKPNILSHFTAKLFAGATFNKRNPRKAFIRREKSVDLSSKSIMEDSMASLPEVSESFSEPCTLPSTENNSVSEQSTNFEDESQDSNLSCGKLRIVNTSQKQKTAQPVSLLQKSMSNSTKLLGSRVMDKGWLDRLQAATKVDVVNPINSSDSGIELTDSSILSLEVKSSPNSATVSQDAHVSDDEDFVCDSDSENDNSRSFSSLTRPKSFFRLPSLTSFNSASSFKRTSSSLTSLHTLNSEVKIAKTDKRPIEAINDDSDSRDCKKAKVENPSKEEMPQSETKPNQSDHENKKSDKCEKSVVKRLVEIQNKTVKTKEEKMEEILLKKVNSGKVNENFVKVNIKKKTYVRGKKTMTFQKYKKQKWKDMKKSQNYSAVSKCFKCGDVGHYAKNCLKACDQLLPKEDLDDEEDSPFPSLKEAEEMAAEASKTMCVRRYQSDLPVHVANEDVDLDGLAPPPPIVNDDIMRLVPPEPFCQPNDDGSLKETPLAVMEALMNFGLEQFRPGQEKAIMRVLSGLSTLVTLSTGSGKSLCYQLPAYLYHTTRQRITLVVSPLVSLMEDQVFGVSGCLRMACLHTNQSPKVRQSVLDQLRENSLHALLVSPESLAAADRLGELLRALPPIAFACIDEAHCISQWSHNFRPSYLMVCQVLREKFGVRTILGLTATATHATIASISEALGLPDGVEGVIRDTPLPDNLRLSVSRDKRKDQALIALLKGERFSSCRSVIVYCTRRDECQRLAAYVRTCLQDVSKEDGTAKRGKLSWNAEAYHAGLTAARRRSVQNAFMSGKTRIVVATVAFGMGINKQDIQGVVHYNMPNAFERYVQEVGRAGRDGRTAHCHLFLNTEGEDLSELRRHVYADSVERHTIRKLLQRVFVPCDCGKECPSHEVAFSIEETVAALDLPEENIETLLCYLELHARQWVHVCSRVYTRCRVLSYKGPKLIRKAAKECPPLAMAVAMEIRKGTKLENIAKLEFPIFPIASAIKWDSGVIKQQLKNLEWTKVNGQPRRSGLTVELYDLGLRAHAPGNLRAEELDCALDSLTRRVERQEATALRQLQAIYDVMLEVSHNSVEDCLDKVDEGRCEKLKSNVRQYFTDESYLDSHNMPEVKLLNEDQVVADVRNLVNSYRDVNFTGRAVARIFHGIASPNFPPRTWGRCRLWRAHLHEDFKLLAKLATCELIKMR